MAGNPVFISRKHINRRTLLRGAGTALALPLLDAMIPAFTAQAKTAANTPPRFFGGQQRQLTPNPEDKGNADTIRGMEVQGLADITISRGKVVVGPCFVARLCGNTGSCRS